VVASVVAASTTVVASIGAFAAVTGLGGRRKKKGEGERTRGFEREGAKMNSGFNL